MARLVPLQQPRYPCDRPCELPSVLLPDAVHDHPPLWLILEIDVRERLTLAVLYDEGLGVLLDLPRWWISPTGCCHATDDRTKQEHRQSAVLQRPRLDSRVALHIFAPMPSVLRELRRRVRSEQSLPRFEPSLPRVAHKPPTGPGWIHEIKHDGFRILAHRQGRAVRLLTRNGNDLANRFPLAAAAVLALPVKSCVVDAEAIVCDENGLAIFDLIRGHGRNGRAILCAFDLLEVNGEDIRRRPIEDRKRQLAGLLRLPHEGIAINEVFGGEGATIYKHACALGCEGIVSKRLGTSYRAGRSAHWLKIKNPLAPAVRRLEEEDWT
jgi:bifunctional non-homologous end joining protein LigD